MDRSTAQTIATHILIPHRWLQDGSIVIRPMSESKALVTFADGSQILVDGDDLTVYAAWA